MNSQKNKVTIIPAVMPKVIGDIAMPSRVLADAAEWVQIDIMDGGFVPPRSWPYGNDDEWSELASLAQEGLRVPGGSRYEAHLMVSDPQRIGGLCAHVGIERLVVHAETLLEDSAKDIFSAWDDAGIQEISLSLLLDTPLSALDPFIEYVTGVQVMGIKDIGFQGHPFDDRTFARIEELHATYPSLMIAVDGGVSLKNAAQLVASGASRLVVGSDLWKNDDPLAEFRALVAATQER